MGRDGEGTGLPLLRVRRLVKSDGSVHSTRDEAVVATARATELFVQHLVRTAAEVARKDRRKVLQYKDLAAAVAEQDNLHFLADIVPERVSYAKALKEREDRA
eukprot:comp12139_c0_seq1/m.6882 comp12139_c0_seq1/g.6882  ORF comp12139_c0_seq1/g.6882 comp12139_c0_seq1/m.6882 type:complete len:103 (-) comp12139_c0_seq1:86-394(-)